MLGRRGCRLVRWRPDAPPAAATSAQLAPPYSRPTEEAWAPGYETAFSDGYPFLLISEGCLDGPADGDASSPAGPRCLNPRLVAAGERPVAMNRFRPNIVVRVRLRGCSLLDLSSLLLSPASLFWSQH